MARASTIRIFLADGTPDGLRVAERSNWSGKVLLAPRNELSRLGKRDELKRPGIYMLYGSADVNDRPALYIGEADNVGSRLRQHLGQDKDFWTSVLVATSTSDTLNKAHVRWLEAALITRARQADQAEVRNGTVGTPVALSEADVAESAAYLDELLILLPVLGLPWFRVPTTTVRKQAIDVGMDHVTVSPESRRVYDLIGPDTSARGFPDGAGFTVLANSVGRTKAVASFTEHMATYAKLRDRLIASGTLTVDGDHVRLTRDHTFSSPSSAASVFLGRSANGLREWKADDGRTLGDDQALAAADG